MGSRKFMFPGLLVAMVLLFSTAVAARDLGESTSAVETSKDTETTEAEPTQYGGGYGGGRGGYGGGYGGGRCRYGCGGGGGGRHCRYGCCGRGYYGCRCCSYAGQAVDAGYEAETHN